MVSGYAESYLQAAITILKARGTTTAAPLEKPVDLDEMREVLGRPLGVTNGS